MDAIALLNEGLNLCARARKMDAIDREGFEAGKRSGSVMMWVEEQYQTDLADWEARTRSFLSSPTVGDR